MIFYKNLIKSEFERLFGKVQFFCWDCGKTFPLALKDSWATWKGDYCKKCTKKGIKNGKCHSKKTTWCIHHGNLKNGKKVK